jgi:hypothetical protein
MSRDGDFVAVAVTVLHDEYGHYVIHFQDGDKVTVIPSRMLSYYPLHENEDRRDAWIERYAERYAFLWEGGGMKSPRFWERWMLNNKITIEESLADIEQRFGIVSRYKPTP